MNTKSKAALAAIVLAGALGAAQPAHATGLQIDEFGFVRMIMAWLGGGDATSGAENDSGTCIDPNG